jgi:hypothetical protein
MAVLGGLWCGSPSNCTAVETTDTPAATLVTGAWQHHKVRFGYNGFTSLYTCDGLEDRVSRILLHVGARKDVKVRARGCPGPDNTPSPTAWVEADFYTLAPVDAAGGSDTVKAQWTAMEVTPRRPNFMGEGDCELIQAMKDLITKNFSLRDLEYRTRCTPYYFTLDGFAVKGQALRAVPPTSSALKS